MLWAIRRDQRGVSNIIVVVLGLVIIVIITSNVILWSYEMNQLDWEKIREDIAIVDVTRVTEAWSYNPSWYTLGGSTTLVNGTVSDLASDNGVYMVFRSCWTGASQSTSQITNGNFTSDASGWNFVLVPGKAIVGGWENTGQSGGSVYINVTTRNEVASGFWNQSFSISQANPNSVTLAFQWKCGVFDTVDSCVIKVQIVHPNATIFDLWNQTVTSTTEWSGVLNINVDPAIFDQTGIYSIRLFDDTDLGNSDTAETKIYYDGVALTLDYITYEESTEVEFTGSSNTGDWSQLNWTVNSAWTIGSVEVTLQLYNYTLDGYPASGNGCMAYTLDGTPNTDETKSQTIDVSPTDFRNATGHWKMKVKGVKATDTQFDSKVDWIEFKVVKISGTLFTFENGGPLTSHLVSLWVINSTVHQRYDISVFVNSGETFPYLRVDICLPSGQYVVKVVTERGNVAVYSGS